VKTAAACSSLSASIRSGGQFRPYIRARPPSSTSVCRRCCTDVEFTGAAIRYSPEHVAGDEEEVRLPSFAIVRWDVLTLTMAPLRQIPRLPGFVVVCSGRFRIWCHNPCVRECLTWTSGHPTPKSQEFARPVHWIAPVYVAVGALAGVPTWSSIGHATRRCGPQEHPARPDRLGPVSAPPGFRVLPRRWVVERTLAWQGQARRLSNAYELLCTTSEAMIHICMSRLMLRRLTRR